MDSISLNSIDIAFANAQYQRGNRIRISHFLSDDSARKLKALVDTIPYYHQACFYDGQAQLIPPKKFSELDLKARQEFIKKIYAQAADATGFWYGRYQPEGAGALIYDQIKSWLESSVILDFVRAVTGHENLSKVTTQITCFKPGDFLTRHNDVVPVENRKVAYVLNLPNQWHPDWGGLLQFYTEHGQPLEAWSPEYNSFGLFDVSHPHSVTSVSQFSPQNRITISGWFHSD
ncbi:2OG-Fe(II) oxygenase family protein [Sessilibacter corallicola]|uniref:2OG-Fe(II) oxygenase family protein n=1 Tax=Sessilibacter corallicola TaxID=2904075 RepID=UPI001E2AFAE8|nr:2OG-Fe(II) oxygenase family protein [Sessilibacter corallicola]MCE2028293.1 2OG-Fe(II) oxygenase [Sessilibacter corallicola]